MAVAIFLNTTPFRIAVNLNSEIENHVLDPMAVTGDQAQLLGWPAPIQTFSGPGVFGGSTKNFLTVFSEGSARPKVWKLRSSVSTALDLYFYIMDAQVTGVSQLGTTEGIEVTRTEAAVEAQILAALPSRAF